MLGKFQFVPTWRVDDVMVSYAPKGGSVGPHVDNYDVFLLQVRAMSVLVSLRYTSENSDWL